MGLQPGVDEVQSKQNAQPVPDLIVSLVANHLDSERTAFHRIVNQMDHRCEADQVLQTMAVVHRSWTDTAQHVLRRRIVVSGRTAMFSLLQSPHVGPWVRDLSVKADTVSPVGPYSGVNVEDNPRLMHGILSKCPNVKNLYLGNFLHPEDRQYNIKSWPTHVLSPIIKPMDVILQIGNLPSLEHLWLINYFQPEPR